MATFNNDAMLMAAAQMLQASGPSRQPQGLGAILGGGMATYMGAAEQARQRKMEEEQAKQVAEFQALKMQELQMDIDSKSKPRAPKYSNDVKVGRGPDGKTFSYVMGDDGQPKILDGIMPRDELKLEDLGGKKVAINPYDLQAGQEFARTQTPDSIASNALTARGQAIQMRGQDMTDSRARDFNGISQGANGLKLMEKAETAKMTKASQVASFDTMLGTLGRLSQHPGLPNSVGLRGALPTMPGSESANFQAELDSFQSQAFIPMVAQLKGMGALSDAEGKKLTAAVGALNPRMGEQAFRESIGRITRDMEGARQRVSGEVPQRQPEPAGGKVATMSDIAETARKSGRSTAEVTAALRAKGYTIGGK